jgi:hypothetical protein
MVCLIVASSMLSANKPDAYNNAGSVSQPQPSGPTKLVPNDSEPASSEEAMLYCPVCSMKLESRKCKLFCAKCGYYMSCADYY